MLPITWNESLGQWEVKDEQGRSLWKGNSYADAAQFVDDYTRQQAIQKALATPGSVRG